MIGCHGVLTFHFLLSSQGVHMTEVFNGSLNSWCIGVQLCACTISHISLSLSSYTVPILDSFQCFLIYLYSKKFGVWSRRNESRASTKVPLLVHLQKNSERREMHSKVAWKISCRCSQWVMTFVMTCCDWCNRYSCSDAFGHYRTWIQVDSKTLGGLR